MSDFHARHGVARGAHRQRGLQTAVACAALFLLHPVQAADAPGWEGAIGLVASRAPAYQGGDERVTKLVPGFFVRYGRFTVTNASGFVTRRNTDVQRGLGLDLKASDRLRVNLALRFDAGRDEGDSPALQGLGDVKMTVRARLTGSWQFQPQWKLGASWGVDLLGRGGGSVADLGLQHEIELTPTSKLSFGASLALANHRYLQTYFGISPEQAARTAYAEYEPGFGLRDVSLSAAWRSELGRHWVALGGIMVARLLGPAADSPLTLAPNSLRVSAGLAYRF